MVFGTCFSKRMAFLTTIKTNMKKVFITSAIAAVALVSCSKEGNEAIKTFDDSITSFREMDIPQGFDFAGSKTVTLTSTGNGDIPTGLKGLLVVKTVDGLTLLKYNRELAQDFEMKIDVPVGIKELVVLNGPIMKLVNIKSSIVDLNSI